MRNDYQPQKNTRQANGGEQSTVALGAVDLMSRTALAAVSQTPTGANAHRLIVVTRYTTKSTGC
jgi:hypothetical protein